MVLFCLPEAVNGRPQLTPSVELRVPPLLSGVPQGLIEVLDALSPLPLLALIGWSF